MGLFKKIFKPVSKVLDKVIPNEIKPALPYLAAFAPVFGPASVQGFIGDTMLRRALTSGALNIGAQLSQEGSEGDINLLSAGLGALSGAMTTPGAAGTFQGMKTPTGSYKGVVDGVADTVIKRPELSFLDQAKNFGLEGLSKGSNLLRPGGEMPAIFSKAGAKAAALPAATATGDVMEAQQRLIDKQAVIDAALEEAVGLADSAASALAIRNAMEAYGFFSEDEILSTIESAGYKAGGRVGFMFGSPDDPKLTEYLMEKMKEKESSKKESPGGLGTLRGPAGMDEAEDRPFKFDAQQFMIDKYNEEGVQPEILGSGFQGDDEIFVISTPGGGTMVITQEQYTENFGERKAKGGRVGAEEGGLMNLGGKEMDLRGGGFVPIGKKERADDVPARLSKNEFVMTADAVRAAGGGSVNKGAKRMYDVMNKLEARA